MKHRLHPGAEATGGWGPVYERCHQHPAPDAKLRLSIMGSIAQEESRMLGGAPRREPNIK